MDPGRSETDLAEGDGTSETLESAVETLTGMGELVAVVLVAEPKFARSRGLQIDDQETLGSAGT